MQLDKPAVKIERPEVKAMPKMPEEEQRRDYEGEGEKKKARYDYETVEVVDRKEVPKEMLYVQLTQQQWDVMGRDSRQRVFKEQVTKEECFFCFPKGHRAFYCPMMLTLAVRLGRHLQQHPFAGGGGKTASTVFTARAVSTRTRCSMCRKDSRPSTGQGGLTTTVRAAIGDANADSKKITF